MSLYVHVIESATDGFIDALRPLLSRDIVLTCGEQIDSSHSIQILVAGVPEREHLDACDNLRMLVIPWAGLPGTTRTLLLERPHIAVHNLHHNAIPTAELAVALMFTVARRILPYDKALRGGDWRPRYDSAETSLLNGKTAVVLGYGAVGRAVARACQGIGMKVVAVSKSGETVTDDPITICRPPALDEVLPVSHVLFVAVPHTPETRGLIGKDQLALLPDGAIIVNVARGPVINEAALYKELASGRISAGLDVWYQYPESEEMRRSTMPSKLPFDKLDNVVMTPHLAGNSLETEHLRATALAELLNAAVEGKPLPNRVDLNRGY